MAGSTSITRRDFIHRAASAATALSLLAASRSDAASSGNLRTDIAIVGAGLAGLTAARELSKARLEVAIFEARDRVDGRTLNVLDQIWSLDFGVLRQNPFRRTTGNCYGGRPTKLKLHVR
jgi:NADPH-dependent 2,4-dienoyl-CoA reductase/sulfur reductase-like enzyme